MKERKDLQFAQYELYIETAEKVSDRRQNANMYFLSINSLILGLSGYLTTMSIEIWYLVLSLIGFMVAFFWFRIIESYRQLNAAKFRVIHEIEENLPISLFKSEWKYLKESDQKYAELTSVEKYVPLVFMLVYIGFAIFTIYGLGIV